MTGQSYVPNLWIYPIAAPFDDNRITPIPNRAILRDTGKSTASLVWTRVPRPRSLHRNSILSDPSKEDRPLKIMQFIIGKEQEQRKDSRTCSGHSQRSVPGLVLPRIPPFHICATVSSLQRLLAPETCV